MALGRCKLCLRQKPLLLSHVVPELLYRPVYGKNSGALSVSEESEHVRILRKGLREPLLCSACEVTIKEYEDYFAKDWIHGSRVPARIPAKPSAIKYEGLDYRLFKLFHLSVAWRMGVVEADDFRPISLGENQEPLRRMILEGTPGAFSEYAVFGYLLRMRKQLRPALEVIALGTPQVIEGLTALHSDYAGGHWYCLLGSAPASAYSELFLREDGSLIMPVEVIGEDGSLPHLVTTRGASLEKAVKRLQRAKR